MRRKFSDLGFLGIDPTLGIGDKILDYSEEEREREKKRVDGNDYYAFCPSCGRRQFKKNLFELGCFICGWKGAEEELELAKVKRRSIISMGIDEKDESYKMNCPNCDALLITEEFKAKGCYICGYRG
ncbi:MAG: hypothetical protein PHN90_00335 [Methanothrix sp.]|jgi:DNA-directed RNA polymerase subunit M/transcription elongation factor TFIIS|nr:hypothetical protein [Methanothrix sp.]